MSLDPETPAPLSATELRRRADMRLPGGPEWQPIRAVIAQLCAAGQSVEWAELIGALAVALQEERFPTSHRHKADRSPGTTAWCVLVETCDGEVGRFAALFAGAIATVLAADDGEPSRIDLRAGMRGFSADRSRARLDLSTCALVDAARARGIPVMKLLRRHGQAVLGQGRWRQRFRGASTDSTGSFGLHVTNDRHLVAGLLANAYVPVPMQRWIQSSADLESAVAEIGFPLVVKGRSVGKGASTTVAIRSPDELRPAIAKVRSRGDDVLIERHVEGDRYDVVVVGGRMVAAERRGGAPDEPGEDVSDAVSPALARLAVRAARIVGLDIAEIKLLTPDISRPLAEVGGAVLGVRAMLRLRARPVDGANVPDVAGAILDHLFPAPRRGRIPTVGVTGTNGKTTTCRMTARIFKQAGFVVGTVTSSGVSIGGEKIASGDLAAGGPGSVVLKDPTVEAAVLELARGGIVKGGLTIGDLDVGMVVNVTEDHLGQDGLQTVEQLARVKRVVVEAARMAAVLNADDEHCRAMAAHVQAPVWWVSRSPDDRHIARHLAGGGHAVLLESDDGAATIVHRHGERADTVIEAAAIPATLGGTALANIENALFATAAGLASGVAVEHVRAALGTFDNSFEMSGGRLNILDVDGIRVVLDYAHNVDGLRKLAPALAAMPIAGRRIAYFGHGGMRTDGFYTRFGAAVAALFDRFVISEGAPLGGRPQGEVSRLIRDGICSAGIAGEAVTLAPSRLEGTDLALAMAQRGDLVFINGNDIDGKWQRIQAWRQRRQAGNG